MPLSFRIPCQITSSVNGYTSSILVHARATSTSYRCIHRRTSAVLAGRKTAKALASTLTAITSIEGTNKIVLA
jgi:hypothetical protein